MHGTAASQARVSTSFSFAETTSQYIAAARSPPRSKPANSRAFLPRAVPRSAVVIDYFVGTAYKPKGGEKELPRLSSRDMDFLRQCVKPGLVGASNERLERIVSESLSSLPAATSEDFLSTLGSFGKAALPALEKAAPSVLQGAAQGGSVGGPYGALIGGGTWAG